MIIEILKTKNPIVKKDSVRYTYIEQYIYGCPLMVEVGVLHFEIGDFKEGEGYRLVTKNNQVLSLVFDGINKDTRFKDQHTTQLVFVPKPIYLLRNNLLNNGNMALGLKIKNYINGGSNLYKVFLLEMRKAGLIFYVNSSFILSKVHLLKYLKKESKYLPQPIKIKKIEKSGVKYNYCSTSISHKAKTTTGQGLPILLLHSNKSDINSLDNYIVPKIELEYSKELLENIGESITFSGIKYVICEKIVAYRGANIKTILVIGQTVK